VSRGFVLSMAKKKASRKKGTRKKSRRKQWQDRPVEMLDNTFRELRAQGQKELNRDDIQVGTEAEQIHVGLPLPALSLRILFQSTVWPLSRICQIVGPEGSGKSAFLYEVYRWHCAYGGGAVHVETENKDSPVLRHAILEHNPVWIAHTLYVPCNWLESWQDACTHYLRSFKELMDNPNGPGKVLPTCIGVDSITAVAPKLEKDEVDEIGHAVRGYPVLANLITRYMRTHSTEHRNYPITIAGVNHVKPAQSSSGGGGKGTVRPGGDQVNYMATHIVEMKRVHQGYDIDLGDKSGLRLTLKSGKNSLGPSRQAITAEFIWWRDVNPHTGELTWLYRWDWETASIEALFAVGRKRKSDFNRIMDIVDLHPVTKGGGGDSRRVWSRELGIPESSPATWREAGALLETRPDVLRQLYGELGVREGYYFQPGLDYADMIRDAAETGAREASTIYAQAPSTMPTLTPDDVPNPDGLGEE